MSSTSPPYHNTTFGAPNQDLNSTTPAGTYLGETGTGQPTSTTNSGTGPAPSTAGPHRTDLANSADPRVDSDLNNRGQYAPGTTMSGTVHPGTTSSVSHGDAKNAGPHKSSFMNKLDPRVDSSTGNTTTKSTNMTGSGAGRTETGVTNTNSAYASGGATGGQTHGSSTGSAGSAPGVQDTRSQYQPGSTGYNPSTGSGYNPSGMGYQPSPSSSSYNPNSQDYRAEHAPSTVNKGRTTGATGTTGDESVAGRTGDQIGQGVKNAYAGIHGAGESLRGALNSAVDRTFGSPEGVEKNQRIAKKGEDEIRAGRY